MVGRRRRPVRRLARAAVVGGGMYAVGRHSANRAADEREQEARLAALEASGSAPQAAYAPAVGQPEPVAAAPDRVVQLQQLAALRDGGVLTEPEFDAEKRRILGS
jgi:hypothetical protein